MKPLRFGVFGGTCEGQVTIDTSGAAPAARLNGTFNGIDMLTLMRETRGTTSLSGKLSGNVAVGTRGSTPDALFAAARGTARVTIADGQVPGLDMVRTVVLAFGKPSGLPPAGPGSAFSKIGGTFSLADRTLHSDDMSFASRDFDMTGAPTIRFPAGQIDMRASVMLSRELTDQAGTDLRRYAAEDGRIVVPAVIGGTVAAPSVSVDVQSISGPGAAERDEAAGQGAVRPNHPVKLAEGDSGGLGAGVLGGLGAGTRARRWAGRTGGGVGAQRWGSGSGLAGDACWLPEDVRPGPPVPVGGAIRARDNDGVAIRVAHPALPVVGAAVAIGRVAMAGQHHLDAHVGRPLHDRVKVIHLEPEQHTIAVGSVGAIADRAVMMFDFKAV